LHDKESITDAEKLNNQQSLSTFNFQLGDEPELARRNTVRSLTITRPLSWVNMTTPAFTKKQKPDGRSDKADVLYARVIKLLRPRDRSLPMAGTLTTTVLTVTDYCTPTAVL